jgi:hypothetical protein
MDEWKVTVIVLGIAGMISLANYLGLTRVTQRREEERADRPLAYQRMETALASQAARLDGQARRIDELEASMDAQERAHRAEMAVLKEELEDAYQGLHLLIEQIRDAALEPVWMPKKRGALKGGAGVETLAARMVEWFNRDELDNLAFDIGIRADSLPGESVETRARQLVNMAKRTGKLEALEGRVTALRPDVK